jgi:hypothetical protein
MFELVVFIVASVITIVALISVVKALLSSEDYVHYLREEKKAACTMEDYAYLDKRYAK